MMFMDNSNTAIGKLLQSKDHTPLERLIPNVTTYTFDPPDRNGDLRSMMSKLRADYTHECVMTYFDSVAIKNRSMPLMVTQSERKPHDPDNLMSPLATKLDQEKNANTDQPVQVGIGRIKQGAVQYQQRVQPSLQDAMDVTMALTDLIQSPLYSEHMDLAEGRTFVAPPLPEGPGELLLKFRAARTERTFTIMGVPMAMLSRESSTLAGKSDIGKKQGAATDAHLNTFLLYQNSQQALKTDISNILTDIFNSIYLPVAKPSSTKAQGTTVTLEIPSIPDQEAVIRFYQCGWLKYDQLLSYLSHLNGIPITGFHPTPQLDIKEANGIVPPAEPSAKRQKQK